MLDIFNYVDDTETETLEPTFKYHRSDETRAKMSVANQRRTKEQNLEYGQRALQARITNGNRLVGERNGMYGKTHTPETCAKMSAARMGKKTPNEVKENRRKTMIERYGKMAVNNNTHTFDGMSMKEFLNKNREYVLSLVDNEHKYKYHKIHDYIIQHHDSDTEISQNYRSMTLSRWFKQV